jgi:hypothetical protein
MDKILKTLAEKQGGTTPPDPPARITRARTRGAWRGDALGDGEKRRMNHVEF